MSLLAPTLPIDHARVVAAIGAAERRTSGEIRVVISRKKAPQPKAMAEGEFERLGMTRTAARNGVLIFLAPASRTFAVVGDLGIHEKCGDGFWHEIANAMTGHFQRGDFTSGLVHGIEQSGSALARHFPRAANDRNELPDDIA